MIVCATCYGRGETTHPVLGPGGQPRGYTAERCFACRGRGYYRHIDELPTAVARGHVPQQDVLVTLGRGGGGSAT